MCVGDTPEIEMPQIARPVRPVIPVETAKVLENERAAGVVGSRRRRRGAAGLTIPMTTGAKIK